MKAQAFLVPEEQLLRKLNRRDEQAFQWLYHQYAHVLYGVILTSVGQASLASRIVEDVFVKAWSDFDQFNPRRVRLLTWLLGRARAEVAAVLARNAVHAIHIDEAAIDYEELDNPIPPEQRSLIDAVYFQGKSLPQLARISQQSEVTLQHRLRTVLHNIKSVFTQ